jgi:5-methyltetrahydrofolate--homocysteine methyltransferase
MVYVAKEMERLGITIPLLIGGATTSEIHTAVKIAPQRNAPVVHVRDASKAVGVSANLISKETKGQYALEISKKYATLRQQHESRKGDTTYISLKEAIANKLVIDWNENDVYEPSLIGNRYFDQYPLEEIKRYIDWTFFFHAWKINGKYPAIFDDPVKGGEARKLFDDANHLLDQIIKDKMLKACCVIGLYRANSVGEDVEIYADETRNKVLTTFRFLRNQQQKGKGIPNLSLADFIAPKSSGLNDYFGGFAVTAGIGLEQWTEKFEKELDDYNSIMMKVLADRLAEAFAELIHQRVRKEFWGYSKNENLEIKAILKEQYQGIRPAPGYPACPEHSEKRALFDLLNAEEKVGITLTENFAMYPAASVSGYYFAHPLSQYFNVGKIGYDQLTDYAKRKNAEIAQIEKWLNANLNYK